MKKIWLKALLIASLSYIGLPIHADSGPLRSVNITPIFENAQVRVMRLTIAPHGTIPLHQVPGRVAVWLTDTRIKMILPNGQSKVYHFKAGDTQWVEVGKHKGVNLSNDRIVAVLIEPKEGTAREK